MKQQIIEALQLSLVPDSNSIKIATENLTALVNVQGFCLTLMEIVDDTSLSIYIRQGALTQLKNTIKRYWDASTQVVIPNQQKSSILDALLTAFTRASSSNLLIKLYREIVCLIIGYEYKNWLPVNALVQKIRNNQDIVPTLQFIIAVCTNFQFSLNDQQRNHCHQFILTIIGDLFSLVQRNQDSEIIYLVMKIIWKTVHYQISDEIRRVLSSGLDFIVAVFGAINPHYENKFDQIQNKGTPEFFYFHAKKWATRIIYRFIYRHANATPSCIMTEQVITSNKQFSKTWYNTYGQKVVEALIGQFSVPTIKKVRYFQLKCLEGLIKNQPDAMKKYGQNFQYVVLPPYLQLQPEDEQIANEDPIEFINRQQDPTINYSNLKKAATEVWLAYATLGSKKKSKGTSETPGVFFYENMEFIRNKLEGSNMIEKQMVMYLICQLRWSINNCKEVRKILPELISKYVVIEFTNEIMFLRARAIEIFNQYGELEYPAQILNKAVEGIYFCLTGDNYPLVRIKAAIAFHVLLNHDQARKLVKPLFQQILKVYLQLIEKYDLQLLVHSLSSIVQHFALQIGPYAWQLIHYLSRHFVKLYHKDNEQSKQEDYDGETQLAAAGILNTMKIILQSPIDGDIIQKMQEDIVPVCEFVFSADDCDYIEDVLAVLRAYTFRAKQISENIVFFYIISIYYVTGIQQQLWPTIANLPLSNQRKKALNNVRGGCNIEALDNVMPVLRNFISKDSELLFRLNDMFGINLLELLFQMMNQIYQKGPNEYDGEVEMNSCTILAIYLIQNNVNKWPQVIINHIWEVAKHNLLKAKSKILKALNAQLICVLLWNCSQHIMVKAHQQNIVGVLLSCVVSCQSKIRDQHQRQRIILGISQLLSMDEKPNQMFQYIEKLFQLVLGLIKKNAELRLDDSADENYQTESDDEDNIQNLLLGDDEPQDIWEQDFGNNYSDKLDQIDEISHFKKSMQTIQNKNNQFYNNLMKTVPQNQLIELDTLMEKAISSYNQNQ